MLMMKAMNWALGPWSSPRQSSFCTHARGMPFGGPTSVCAATAMTPTSFLLRVEGVAKLDRVSNLVYSRMIPALL